MSLLHDAALQAMHTPVVKDRLGGLGAMIVPDERATPEYLGGFVKGEIENALLVEPPLGLRRRIHRPILSAE